MIQGLVESGLGQVSGMAITAALGTIVVSLALWTMVRPSRFPPGPRGLPVVGSIFSMNDSPEVVFSKWAKKYGDIFSFKVGERWMVVLNGGDVIKEAVIKQGVDFADRPDFYSAEIMSEGFKDIVFSPYSDTWKLHRKLAHTALRHFATGKPLQHLVSGVYPKVEKELLENAGKPIEPRILLMLLMYNVLSTMCFGKSYELKDPNVLLWKQTFDEANEKFGLGLAADFFSWARYIPTSGPKLFRDICDKFYGTIRKELAEHKGRLDPTGDVTDFYTMMLKAQQDARDENSENIDKLTDTHVLQTIGDVFLGGIETTTNTLYWAFALMTEYQEIQTKVRAEIDCVIGRDRVPNIEDRGSLPYTEATLYEVMRYSSIAPIAVPHSTTCDTEFRGYRIPKGTVVMINTYSMHFDPKEWDDPHSFKPEHFLDPSGTVRKHPTGFLPFGAGRRSCLGEAVAKADLFLIFTWFMQNYTFRKVPGKEAESLLEMIPQTAAGRILKLYEILIDKRD